MSYREQIVASIDFTKLIIWDECVRVIYVIYVTGKIRRVKTWRAERKNMTFLVRATFLSSCLWDSLCSIIIFAMGKLFTSCWDWCRTSVCCEDSNDNVFKEYRLVVSKCLCLVFTYREKTWCIVFCVMKYGACFHLRVEGAYTPQHHPVSFLFFWKKKKIC